MALASCDVVDRRGIPQRGLPEDRGLPRGHGPRAALRERSERHRRRHRPRRHAHASSVPRFSLSRNPRSPLFLRTSFLAKGPTVIRADEGHPRPEPRRTRSARVGRGAGSGARPRRGRRPRARDGREPRRPAAVAGQVPAAARRLGDPRPRGCGRGGGYRRARLLPARGGRLCREGGGAAHHAHADPALASRSWRRRRFPRPGSPRT